MNTVYLAWEDPQTKRWLPIGKLTAQNGRYQFAYTKGAHESSGFVPIGKMHDLTKVYESDQLFPLFANRLLPKNRPEYKRLLDWLDLEDGQDNPLVLLARTEGIRETDPFEVFHCPEPGTDGSYSAKFFSHGMRYLGDASLNRVDTLAEGDRLYMMLDPQNPHDRFAVALRTDDPATIVGYCPRYLTQDFNALLAAEDGLQVSVGRINRDAPAQFRLFCHVTAKWPEGFRACLDPLFEPLAGIGLLDRSPP